MTLFAEVNAHRVIEARVFVPSFGRWIADVKLDGAVALAGKVTFTIADLSLVGTVVRGAPFQGAGAARLVAGFGGWAKQVSPKFYRHSSVGVKLSGVVGDLAREVGEKVSIPTDRAIGPSFTREGGPACRVLSQLAPAAWYVDADGTTRLSARPAGKITGAFVAAAYDAARGVLSVSTDTPAEWVPGRTVTIPTVGTKTIAIVTHVIRASELRTEVLVA
jgi:hypothetical protein